MTALHAVPRPTVEPPTPNPDEARVLALLRGERPDLLAAYLGRLADGRRGIVHRLLHAIIREDVAGAAVRTAHEDGGHSLRLALRGGRSIAARVARRGAFGRLEFEGDVTLESAGRSLPIDQPRRLLELALDGSGEPVPEAFARELDNSAANLALALVGADRRRAELKAEAVGVRSSLEWVERKLASDPTFDPLVFYEQWVIEGHPLHPGTKIKIGMEPGDVIRHAPEWGACPGLALVAVARRACRVESVGGAGPAEILLRDHPALRPIVEDHLVRSGLRPADYELVPVHPWQLEHTIPRLHAGGIARGEVVPVPGALIPASALISVRSLAMVGRRGERRHVKAALAVQMTNAVRTVSPQAAANGPMLTHVLAELQDREGGFGGRFAALREDVGISYEPTDPTLDPDDREQQRRHLGAILREAPEDHAEAGEIALPAAALTVDSPIDGAPVVVELIDRYAKRRGIADPGRAAVAFLGAYADVSVAGFLTLMTRYGVSLEGHLQNSVAVVRLDDGAPVRMLVRDLGGVRVLPDRLARRGVSADFREGSATVASGVDDLRDKVFYAYIQNHLGELIAAIARHRGLDEAPLWRPIAAACRATFRSLKADPAIAEQAAADEAALFGPTLRLKALARMRLRGEVVDYRFAEVPNPLAGAEGPG